MMARIGFRRVLPILFTLIHISLVLYASVHQPHKRSSNRPEDTYHPTAYQENGAIGWEPSEPKPLSRAQKIAIVLNLPAFLAVIPIVATFFPGNDLADLYGSTPFVPPIWVGIGRWLDGMLGYAPRRRPVRRTWDGLFVVLSLGLLGLSIVSITPLNHHRTGDTYWVGSALILWSSLLFAISVSGLIRRKNG